MFDLLGYVHTENCPHMWRVWKVREIWGIDIVVHSQIYIRLIRSGTCTHRYLFWIFPIQIRYRHEIWWNKYIFMRYGELCTHKCIYIYMCLVLKVFHFKPNEYLSHYLIAIWIYVYGMYNCIRFSSVEDQSTKTRIYIYFRFARVQTEKSFLNW